jgi:hypothetical protein
MGPAVKRYIIPIIVVFVLASGLVVGCSQQKSEIGNYLNEMIPIGQKINDDSDVLNRAMQTLAYQPIGETQTATIIRLSKLRQVFVEGVNRVRARQVEIVGVVPPTDARTHYTKILMAMQKQEQALVSLTSYTDQVLKLGIGESAFLQRGNDLRAETSQLLMEANTELAKLYKIVGR